MQSSPWLRAGLAIVSAIVGITAAALPDNWIEQRFGFSPDGGNGFAEFLWVAAPLALAGILGLSLRRRRQRTAARL